MIQAERHDQIVRLLEGRGVVSVREIAESLGVSDMTVRRDLGRLAEQGVLVRVHGGARIADGRTATLLGREYSHTEKRARNAAEKRAIARKAASLVQEGQTVYLGTGTTVEMMVPALPSCRLRIITNSLSVFNLLEARDEYDLCLVGGSYRRRTSAFVGPLAEDAIGALGTDIAFVGANGVLDNAVFTSNMEEGKLQHLAFTQSGQRVLLVDSSKFGVRDFYAFYALSDLDALVCEPDAPREALERIEHLTRVIC